MTVGKMGGASETERETQGQRERAGGDDLSLRQGQDGTDEEDKAGEKRKRSKTEVERNGVGLDEGRRGGRARIREGRQSERHIDETERQKERERERETERQRDRERGRERETEGQRERETERQRDRETEGQ